MAIKRYLFYVLRRTALVLFCLGAGLLAWPGDVGAVEIEESVALDL